MVRTGFDIVDKLCLARSSGGSTYSTIEIDSQAAVRALVGTDDQEIFTGNPAKNSPIKMVESMIQFANDSGHCGNPVMMHKEPYEAHLAQAMTLLPDSAMLPKPGSNAISYHGVVGARAAWRREVVPSPPQTVSLGKLDRAQDSIGPAARPWAYAWAGLLWRLYSTNPWNCPYFGCRMQVRAIVLPPAAIRAKDGLYVAAEKSARAPPNAFAAAK